MTVVAFILVAAAFTVVRAVLTAGASGLEIPWRTFAVNIIGALALGFIVARWNASVVVTTAALGSLTTFSTVASEAGALVDNHHKRLAITYVGLTLVAGVAAAWIGLSIGDSL